MLFVILDLNVYFLLDDVISEPSEKKIYTFLHMFKKINSVISNAAIKSIFYLIQKYKYTSKSDTLM